MSNNPPIIYTFLFFLLLSLCVGKKDPEKVVIESFKRGWELSLQNAGDVNRLITNVEQADQIKKFQEGLGASAALMQPSSVPAGPPPPPLPLPLPPILPLGVSVPPPGVVSAPAAQSNNTTASAEQDEEDESGLTADELLQRISARQKEFLALRQQLWIRDLHQRLRTAVASERAKVAADIRRKEEAEKLRAHIQDITDEIQRLREEKIRRDVRTAVMGQHKRELEQAASLKCQEEVAEAEASPAAAHSGADSALDEPPTPGQDAVGAFVQGWKEGQDPKLASEVAAARSTLLRALADEAEASLAKLEPNPAHADTADDADAEAQLPDYLKNSCSGGGCAAGSKPVLAHIEPDALAAFDGEAAQV